MNLASFVRDSARRRGEATALRLDDAALTYAELDDAAARMAGLLASRGVEPGDRVVVMLPNVCEFGVVYYGALYAGAAVVPANVMLRARELEYLLADSGARALLAWHALAETAEAAAQPTGAECVFVTPGEFERLLDGAEPHAAPVDRAPDDTAVILYTSGTTGEPKGAELTHANLAGNAAAAARLFRLGEDDVTVGALPLFHSYGQTCVLNASMRAGGAVTLIARFDPEKVLEVIERDRATVFHGVPTMYAALLHDPGRERHDISSLRLCGSGGAAMPVEVMRAFEDAFGSPILEGYGLSETSPVASFNHLDRERKPGSIGTPIEGVEMRLVDEDDEPVDPGEVGEIVIRGPNVMKGYWNRPEETEAALRGGWLHTGDMARMDGDGYFFIVDRKKDLIIRGGYNVYPREVEEVLHGHPGVREAAVVGVPHPTLGEEVGAAVAPKAGAQLDPAEVREWVRERVAPYKYPRHVWVVDELPKGPTGKVLKREITVPADLEGARETAVRSPAPGS